MECGGLRRRFSIRVRPPGWCVSAVMIAYTKAAAQAAALHMFAGSTTSIRLCTYLS
jgi:hypothetical protein